MADGTDRAMLESNRIQSITNATHTKSMKLKLLIPVLLLPALATLPSCKEKGPAEKVGEKVDKAAEKVKDAVDPKGPVEKAGEKIDNALGK